MPSYQYCKVANHPELLLALEQQIISILRKYPGKRLTSSEISGFIYQPDVIKALVRIIETSNPRWNIKSVIGAVAEEMSRQGKIKKGSYRADPITQVMEETWYI